MDIDAMDSLHHIVVILPPHALSFEKPSCFLMLCRYLCQRLQFTRTPDVDHRGFTFIAFFPYCFRCYLTAQTGCVLMEKIKAFFSTRYCFRHLQAKKRVPIRAIKADLRESNVKVLYLSLLFCSGLFDPKNVLLAY